MMIFNCDVMKFKVDFLTFFLTIELIVLMGDPSPWPHLRRVTRHRQRRRHRSSKHTVPRSESAPAQVAARCLPHHSSTNPALQSTEAQRNMAWHVLPPDGMAETRMACWSHWGIRKLAISRGPSRAPASFYILAWRERIDWSVHVSSLVLISVQGLKISGSCSGPRIFGTSACHVLRQPGWHMVHQNSLALLNCPAKDIFPFPGVILWRNGSLLISLSAPTVVHERAFCTQWALQLFWAVGLRPLYWHVLTPLLGMAQTRGANGPASTVNYFSLKC